MAYHIVHQPVSSAALLTNMDFLEVDFNFGPIIFLHLSMLSDTLKNSSVTE